MPRARHARQRLRLAQPLETLGSVAAAFGDAGGVEQRLEAGTRTPAASAEPSFAAGGAALGGRLEPLGGTVATGAPVSGGVTIPDD